MTLNEVELKTASTQDIFKLTQSSPEGLTTSQVEQQRLEFGSNQMKERGGRTWWQLIIDQFRSSFVLVLLGAVVVSIILREWFDAGTIIIILVANAVMGFVQEFHSQKITEKLKSIIQLDIDVRRDNKVVKIPKEEVVTGDVLLVKPGTVLPADVRWVVADRLSINESVLTGESVSVNKTTKPLSSAPGAVMGLAGTHVMSGYGEGVVVATGAKSALGKIIQLTSSTKRVSSFEQGIKKLSRFMLWLVTVTLVVVFVVNIATKGTDQLFTQLLFAIALAVSVIPEALPAVVTITFTKGALRLSKKKVVVKRLSAIEDLGHIQVLCTDKTGTITKNDMIVKEVASEDKELCLRYAFLESNTEQSTFDLAIEAALPDFETIRKDWKTTWSLPFDPERKRSAAVIQKGKESLLLVKGNPEVILELCDDLPGKQEILQQAKKFGTQGMRVLAVAFQTDPKEVSPDVYKEAHLEFLGLIAFEDPLKETAKQAIADAEELGVQVKILTGDGAEVARAIAVQVGIMNNKDQVMTGAEFTKLSSAQKEHAVSTIKVFARVAPEEKYAIIQELQRKYVVGFLGEGINDAPALQMANIGLVVKNGSDVAREAGDIILLDNSLEVIVDGIKEGRTIFANVSKYIRYTLIGNFGGFYALAGVSLLIDFLPMLPIQILLTNLLTDLPLVAVATDHVDPLDVKTPQFYNIREIAFVGILLGLVSSIFDFVFFAYFRHSSPETIQTLWFILSIMTELALIFFIRSRRFFLKAGKPHFSLVYLIAGVFTLTLTMPYIPFTAEIFHFIQPSFQQLTVIFGIVIAYLVTTEVSKIIYYKFAPGVENTR